MCVVLILYLDTLLCVNSELFISSVSVVDMDLCWEDDDEEEGDG